MIDVRYLPPAVLYKQTHTNTFSDIQTSLGSPSFAPWQTHIQTYWHNLLAQESPRGRNLCKFKENKPNIKINITVYTLRRKRRRNKQDTLFLWVSGERGGGVGMFG